MNGEEKSAEQSTYLDDKKHQPNQKAGKEERKKKRRNHDLCGLPRMCRFVKATRIVAVRIIACRRALPVNNRSQVKH